MRLEQYEKASKRFDEAYPLLVKEKMARELVMHQTYSGELKMRCVSTAPPSGSSTTPSILPAPWPGIVTDAHADSYPGRLELTCGNPSAAARLANQALALAAKIGEMAEKGAVLRILAQIAVTDIERPEPARLKASRLFTEALEVYEEINARFERAETMVLMGLA